MSGLPIIVIGAGGHAKVLLDTLLNQEQGIIGIVDKEISTLEKELLGIRILVLMILFYIIKRRRFY